MKTRTAAVLEQIRREMEEKAAAMGPSVWREPIQRDTRTYSEIVAGILDKMERLNVQNGAQRFEEAAQ